MREEPYFELVATAELDRLAAAIELVDHHAELNHRYRRLIHECQRELAAEQVRLTQARGMAKKLMVLAKTGGDDLRGKLDATEHGVLDAGLAQADELVYPRDSGSG